MSVTFQVGWTTGPEKDLDDYEDPTVDASLDLLPIEADDPTIFIRCRETGDKIWFNWSELLDALNREALAHDFNDFAHFIFDARLGPGPKLL